MREAFRTSVLSYRWRYLWKDSLKFYSSLVLDVNGMRDSEYTDSILESKKKLSIERYKFARWVDQMLHLDYGPLLDTFRLRFEMRNDFSHYIDRWISVAIAKRVQKFDIDLSEFLQWGICPNNKLYRFPSRLFTKEAVALVNCLYLNSCVLGTLDFKCFSSLIDLKLNNVLVDQDTVAKFLTECPNLERMWLVACYRFHSLTISGSSLKLKELAIVRNPCLRDVEINAKNLNKLEFRGVPVKFSFVNAPVLSNVSLVCSNGCTDSFALQYVLGNLSSDLPKLETLFVVVNHLKVNIIPNKLSPYINLKKLVLKVVVTDPSLWGLVPLLCAAPRLQVLELHWHLPLGEKSKSSFSKGQRPSDSPHPHLKEILVTGFYGSNYELEFMQYIFGNCEALQSITLDSRCKVYHLHGLCDAHHTAEWVSEMKKIMQRRVRKLLMPVVPSRVQLTIL
ncbi:hypothetical protein ACHQM5_019379 [Ranunculus cassubicifolius]